MNSARKFKNAFLLIILIFSIAAPFFAEDEQVIKIQNAPALRKSFYKLDGNWNYFKYTIIEANQFYPRLRNRGGVPVKLPHRFEDGVFYSTYHARVEGLIPHKVYAMSLYGAVNTTCRVWCNGRLIGTGGFFSKSRYFARAGQVTGIVEFSADGSGVADLVLHVADFESSLGGIVSAIQITEKEHMDAIYYLNFFLNKFLTAFFLAIIFYNLILAIMNIRQRLYGFLLALLLCYIASIAFTGDISLAYRYFPRISFRLEVRIAVALLALESFLAVCYIDALHKIPFRPVLMIHIASVFNFVAVLLVPLNFYLRFNMIFVLIALCVQLYAFSLPAYLGLKKKIRRTQFFMQHMMIQNISIALYLLIFLGQFAEFVLVPLFNPPVRTYILFKLSFFIFGIIQCGNAAFRRDTMTRRVDNYFGRLSFNNDTLARFIPDQMLKLMNTKDITKIIPGECRIIDAMIMFVGIKRFSDLSESVPRAELFETVRDLNAMIDPVIYETGGFIIKHMYYGNVIVFPEKNSNAIICAARIQKKMGELRRMLRRTHRTDIDAGIAIHSGRVACGVLGSANRLDTVAVSADMNITVSIGKEISKINAKILITEEAMPYCRVYADFMYEGHFFMIDTKQILVYSAMPVKMTSDNYEETLESVEDDDDEK